MAARITPFFLPLRRQTLAALVDDGVLPSAPAELSALFVVALCRGAALSAPLSVQQVERALMEVQALMLVDTAVGADRVRAAWAALPRLAVEDIVDELAVQRLILAPAPPGVLPDRPIEAYDSQFQAQCQTPTADMEIIARPVDEMTYELDEDEREPDPDADPDLSLTYRITFNGTRAQASVARTVSAMPDEHVDVDAYAGAGKTHLVMALASSAPRTFTYVAPYAAHLHGARKAADAHGVVGLRTKTLYEIALEAAQPLAAQQGIRTLKLGAGTASPAERAARAGITGVGPHSAEQVLGLAERAISAWAETDAPAVSAAHFRRLLPALPEAARAPYVLAAAKLWSAMWVPRQRDRAFALRVSHLAKWLTQSGAQIPAHNGTLLVDEAHDLMPAWRQLLDTYSGGCVFLGDPYQRLSGRVPRNGRNKLMVMSQSFRLGLNGEQAIRQTLESAPDQRVFDPFTGARDHITRVRHWRGRGQALGDGLRVYASEWALLEDAQRLKTEGGRFRLLPASARALKELVADAATLFNQRSPGWMGLAGGHRTWEDLAAALAREGREKVVRMFERGFNETRFDETLAAQAPEDEARIFLGLVPHVKNLEFSAVALNDCCFTPAQLRHGHVPAHAAYLAMSRVRDELWLPGDAFDRLTDLRAQAA